MVSSFGSIYIDNILLTTEDVGGIEEVKEYLRKYFDTKDMGRSRFFLGIEIAHNRLGVSLSQWKYAFDLLQETMLFGCKSTNTPMDTDAALWDESGPEFDDVVRYKTLVGRFIYLIVTGLILRVLWGW